MALEDEVLSPDEKKEEKREIKPEAKLAPYLFVQEGTLEPNAAFEVTRRFKRPLKSWL
jgi:hypothetical protein